LPRFAEWQDAAWPKRSKRGKLEADIGNKYAGFRVSEIEGVEQK
jgi:hypothetical protein